jgi:branched-chain amino acid transport system permease protein
MKILKKPGFWLPVLLVALVGIWPILTQNAADREIVNSILLSAALASSLNILLGYTGYVSFGHIVFFGFGAYTGFYLMSEQGWSIYAAMLMAGLVPGILAYLLGSAILRLRGAYF